MKISFLTAFSLSCAVVLSICSTSASAIQYHKWVDAKGVTHYTKDATAKICEKKPPQWIPMAGKIQHRHHLERAETEVQTENTPQEQQQQAPQVPANQDQQQREANEALQQSKNRAVAL